MKNKSDTTRSILMKAALEMFATGGFEQTSLLSIVSHARVGNRGAIHYHFGSRTRLLEAIFEEHLGALEAREAELVRLALSEPKVRLKSLIHALVRPLVELANSGDTGHQFVVVLSRLLKDQSDVLQDHAGDTLLRWERRKVFDLIREMLRPTFGDQLLDERLALCLSFIVSSVSKIALPVENESSYLTKLPVDAAIQHLCDMTCAMLQAPSSRTTSAVCRPRPPAATGY